MSEITRPEVLARKRIRYARACREDKSRILNEVVELFGYHRKGPSGHRNPAVRDPAKLSPKK